MKLNKNLFQRDNKIGNQGLIAMSESISSFTKLENFTLNLEY